MDRRAPTLRPKQKPQGTQRWDNLLFSHWEILFDVLRPLVPDRLTLDTFEGRCFVGVVAFTMRDVRPFSWLPPMPTARLFHEINLRTYVHFEGKEPGIYFFSLDAASSLAVLAARSLWHLPYFRMSSANVEKDGNVIWKAQRRWPRPHSAPFQATFHVGKPLAPTEAGSLRYFLAERYQFYAEHPDGRLLRARVHHTPYDLYQVEGSTVSSSLLLAAGLPDDGSRTEDLFSPGVNVEIYPLEEVARRAP